MTTTGAYSFTSVSSGTTYSGATGGEQQLFNDLALVLSEYSIASLDWNLIRGFIYGSGNPITDGIQTQLIRTNGVLTEVRLYQSDLTTLMIKTVLNRVNGNLDNVDTFVYASDGTSVLLQFKDTLTRTDGQLTSVTRTVQIS